MQFDEEKETLILYGKESMESLHKQSLVGRRREHWAFEAETRIRFEPDMIPQIIFTPVFPGTSQKENASICWNADMERNACQVISQRLRKENRLR